MKLDRLEAKLIAAARSHPPSDAVPYAFEQRVMARIGKAGALDQWAAWAAALWKAAAPCVVIALLLGTWTVFNPATSSAATDLSQQLENTLFVSVTQDLPASEGNSTW
jgi:hypothetical protein